MPSSARLDYLKTIHQTFHEQLRTADQKAALIFTFLLALMLWSPELRSVFFSGGFEPGSLKGIATIVLIVALVFSISCVLFAVIPRDRPGGVALYWGAWPQAGVRLLDDDADENPAIFVQDYVENASHLAALCKQKFRWVRFAMLGFILSLAAHLAIIVA